MKFSWDHPCKMENVRPVQLLFPDKQVLMGMLLVMIFATACTTPAGLASKANKKSSVDLFMASVEAQRAYQESRWLDAVRYYQQIVEHIPSDAVAWFRLANTYAQQGAFERAIFAYEQSLTYDNEQPKAWFNLSTAYLLSAQSAMQQARIRMSDNNPAKVMLNDRLRLLSSLIHTRVEESSAIRTPGNLPNK